MRLKQGLTLIELLVVVFSMSIILGAVSSVVLTSFRHTDRVKASRETSDRDARFEDRLRQLLQSAYLSTNQADTSSFFLSGAESETTLGSNGTPGQLVFTALSDKVPSEMLNSTDDFETVNQTYGPHGAITEVSLSTSPVGEAPVQTGLFYRHQTPADGDSTQGGIETVFDSDIDTISFEFFDGTDWLTTWDTQSQATPRLPAAVRVTYTRSSDNSGRVMVVRLIHSDVTPDNPVEQAPDGGQQ